MSPLLPDFPLLLAFLMASFLLAVMPGPGVFYILGRSISGGTVAGIASVAGVFVGNFINMLAAVLGMAALFKVWPLSFVIIKYAGAAYIVFLAVEALRKKSKPLDAIALTPVQSQRRLFVDGLLVALFNPKTLIFFAAFLPQFLSKDAGFMQPLLLGSIFVVMALVTDSAYALAGAWAGRHVRQMVKAQAVGRYAMALLFIALAAMTVMGGE